MSPLVRFTPEGEARSIETERGKIVVNVGSIRTGERMIAATFTACEETLLLTKEGARGLRDLINDALGRL